VTFPSEIFFIEFAGLIADFHTLRFDLFAFHGTFQAGETPVRTLVEFTATDSADQTDRGHAARQNNCDNICKLVSPAMNSRRSAFEDARLAPAYGFREAAHYLRLPVPTLRSWCLGLGKTPPVFQMDDPRRKSLSFMNMVEAHILAGIRRHHGVGLPQVRRALDYVQEQCAVDRPLIHQSFETDGRFLFIQQLERLVNASKSGQLAMPDLLPQLERIERDPRGFPAKLYPCTRPASACDPASDPKIVVMNPRVSFGRPSVGGVPTSAIWGRFRAGDSPHHLAADYGLPLEAIEEAIRCEAA